MVIKAYQVKRIWDYSLIGKYYLLILVCIKIHIYVKITVLVKINSIFECVDGSKIK
jgi:hypothetical protein